MFSVKGLVGLYGSVGFNILNVSKSFAGAEPSIKGNMNLNKSAIVPQILNHSESNVKLRICCSSDTKRHLLKFSLPGHIICFASDVPIRMFIMRATLHERKGRKGRGHAEGEWKD